MEKGWKEKGECLPGLAVTSDGEKRPPGLAVTPEGEKANLATSDGRKFFRGSAVSFNH